MNEKILSAINTLSQKIDEYLISKTWLTVPEAGQYLNISESKLRKLIADNKIPCNRIDGKILFHIRKLELWTLSDGTKTTFNKSDRKLLEVLQ